MNEKKQHILEQAMILFATKGYHSTSIQEIAEHAGVSKGGVYIYFSSKNELLVEIYRYYYQRIKDQINQYENKQDLQPKERLQLQIKVYMEELLNQKEFIIMHINENVSHSKELKEFIFTTKRETFNWYKQSILSIYGENAEPYVVDISIILNGILENYLMTLFTANVTTSLDKLTSFIISRLDDIVDGLIAKQEKAPFHSYMNAMDSTSFFNDGPLEKNLETYLMKLEDLILDIEITEEIRKDCLESIEFLKEEAQKENPKKVVFQGLLNNLREIQETKALVDNLLMTFSATTMKR